MISTIIIKHEIDHRTNHDINYDELIGCWKSSKTPTILDQRLHAAFCLRTRAVLWLFKGQASVVWEWLLSYAFSVTLLIVVAWKTCRKHQSAGPSVCWLWLWDIQLGHGLGSAQSAYLKPQASTILQMHDSVIESQSYVGGWILRLQCHGTLREVKWLL